jgi:pilus assembly protein Flp/PilA
MSYPASPRVTPHKGYSSDSRRNATRQSAAIDEVTRMTDELRGIAQDSAPAVAIPGVRRTLATFLRDEDGVTAIEYGLLAVLIVVVASGAIALMGGGTNGMWTKISAAIAAAIPY